MTWLEVNNKYIENILKDKEVYIKDYELTLEKVKNSTAQYKGKPVPFLYHPMFFTEDDIRTFEEITDLIISISNKITREYIENPDFRPRFKYQKELEDLILVDPGYDMNIPIARFDIFYKDRDNFKFCELNTDGSSAMNEDNEIARILMGSQAVREIKKDYELYSYELIDSWVEESLKIYKDNKGQDRPNVAILDLKESATSEEFKLFKKAYEDKGLKCEIVDPRDLTYRDSKLYHKDFRIDMVYRRLVTFEMIQALDEIGDFVRAYKDGAFFSIGSIRSQIMHNKIIFKILHDEDTLQLLTNEEREFIKNHVPYTREFIGDEEVFNHVLENKDKYIMKPLDLNASRGVYAGRDYTMEVWEKKLRESFNKDYIYQEFVDPYERDFVTINQGDIKLEKFGAIVGLFLYGEKFAGLYTRIGQESIISGLTSYYTVPNMLAKKI